MSIVQSDKKILFIGPFRTASSWGIACREYLKSLSLVFPNITVNDFYMGGGRTDEIPNELRHLENQRFDDYDTCIQMCLPHYFYRDGRFRNNIGITFTESVINSHYDPRIKNAQLLDNLIISSPINKLAFSGLTKVSEIPVPIDVSLPYKKYRDLASSVKQNEKTFTFYTIADYSERKNLKQLIEAFLVQFRPWDNVSLVIKSNVDLEPVITEIKKRLGIACKEGYAEIRLITGNLAREDILAIHQSCDCYINVSHGEGFCIPAYEAAVFGNYIIYPGYYYDNFDGPGFDTDWFSNQRHRGIRNLICWNDVCSCPDAPLPDYYNARDDWFYFNTRDIMDEMRIAAKTKGKYTDLRDLSELTYESVAEKLRAVICQD